MFPLRDDIPAERTPYVNYCLIAINAGAWLYEVALGAQAQALFITAWGLVPLRLFSSEWWALDPTGQAGALVAHMFLHGSWMHAIGNIWFLWIFGDNVEGRLGHGRYLLFYLLCGLGAAAAQVLVSPASRIPMVGASGAISGVLGAYLLLFPGARVLAVIPIFIFLHLIQVPAWIFVGLWAAVQLLQGALSLGGPDTGGVAWWAHIGGFAVGFAWIVRSPKLRRPPRRRRTNSSGWPSAKTRRWR
jgi:membrane associated rhomboid family serine protease